MQYINEFSAVLSRQRVSDNTITNYVRVIEDHFAFIQNHKTEQINPCGITQFDIAKYIDYQINIAKLQPRTVSKKRSVLVKFYDYLFALGVIDLNPAKSVKILKMRNENIVSKLPSQDDLDKLANEIYKGQNPRDIVVFELLYNTGIRVSELCNIELGDIKLDGKNSRLTVKQNNGFKNCTTRVIPLNARVQESISVYKCFRPLTANTLFLRGTRGVLSVNAVHKILQKYAEQSGIEKVSSQMLRKQFLVKLCTSGLDMITIAYLAGHSSPNSLTKYSLQPLERKLTTDVDILKVLNTI